MEFLELGKIFLLYFSWWFIPVVGLLLAKKKGKQFPLDAVIFERRNDNIIKTNDRIGKIYDKNNFQTNYRLMKAKDMIDVIPFEAIMHTKFKATSFLELILSKIRGTDGTVFLYKYGSKQYKPIKTDHDEVPTKFVEIKNEKGDPLYVQIYQPFDPRDQLSALKFTVIDWDDVNTAMNEIMMSNNRRTSKMDKFLKFLVPVALAAVTGIICVIFIYLTFQADMNFCEVQSSPTQSAASPNIPIISDVLDTTTASPPQ